MNCIFCTRRANSGEHVWPDAIAEELEATWGLDRVKNSFTAVEVVRGGQPAEPRVKKRSGPLNRKKIPAVCTTCNNGWMNRLDERVRPFVRSMMHGHPTFLNSHDVRALASWVTMKMMVVDQENPPTAAFTNADYIQFYLTGLPNDNVHISLASCGHRDWAAALHRQSRLHVPPREASFRTTIVTWGIGYLIILFEKSDASVGWADVPAPWAVPLWPKDGDVRWPPIFQLRTDHISDFALRYDGRFYSAADTPIRDDLDRFTRRVHPS